MEVSSAASASEESEEMCLPPFPTYQSNQQESLQCPFLPGSVGTSGWRSFGARFLPATLSASPCPVQSSWDVLTD